MLTELRRLWLYGTVDENNTSADLLGGGGVFEGDPTDLTDIGTVIISVHADVASATDGLEFYFSSDLSHWDLSDVYSISAGSLKTFTLQPVYRYFKLRYVNGAAPQTEFDLQVQLRTGNVKSSSHRVQDSITDEDDAELQKSVVSARQANGDYDNVRMDTTGSLNIAFGDGANLDAFSRLRVGAPATIFDSTFDYNLAPLLYEQSTTGAGTITHSALDSSALMAVGGVGSAILQSRAYHRYIPGKSQLVLATGVVGSGVATVTKRVGYFEGDNGLFFEQNGVTDIAFVRRTNTSGAPVDNRVPQANWNIDPLDGTGPSGITLDVTKAYILVVEFQWLGMGRVRMGFDIDGRIYMAHQFLNANNLATVYMERASLPIRWEIVSTSAASNMLATCSSVQSEGGSEAIPGYHFAFDNGSVTAASGAQTLAFNFRRKTAFPTGGKANRQKFNFLNFGALVTGNSPVLTEVYYDTTVGGAPAWTDYNATYSGLQYDLAGTPSGGIKVSSFYTSATAQAKGAIAADFASRLPFALDIAGATATNMTVYVTGIGGNSACRSSLEWEEVR